MKTVLVTGANGQLGQSLQKIAHLFEDFTFVFKNSRELDITDDMSVKATFEIDHYDFCINCAAYTDVEQAEKNPDAAFKVNSEGVKNLALACNVYDVKLIHISTDYIFDGKKKSPYTTRDIPNPINEYGKSKLLGEVYIKENLKNYVIIRTSWLYSEFGENFYKTVLKRAKSGHDLYVTNTQTGCPTNANNLALHILEILSEVEDKCLVSHFTDDETMTWYDFAKKIVIDNGLKVRVSVDNIIAKNRVAKRPIYSVLKTEMNSYG